MNILVIGSGGREHALSWKLSKSPKVKKIYVAPGNGGTHREPKVENVHIDPLDFNALIRFAKDKQISLTVVGPEAPLVAGIVESFEKAELPIFGPSQLAAKLEGSKAYAKEFMQKHKIPTAEYNSFNNLEEAKNYLEKINFPIVIKADGLAAGKGVVIAQDKATAQSTLENMLTEHTFGHAGDTVVIEEFLTGEEASFIVMSDGVNILPFATSQDHKARDNGDKGPNTGGMGAYSPAPIVTSELHDKVMSTIVKPSINGLRSDGSPFVGFLYVGLMISETGEPKVLEYNVRFGDPETQPILLRLKSDLFELCQAAVNKQLDHFTAEWDERVALGVVMAANGYPGKYASGEVIGGLNDIPRKDSYKIFHAGTKIEEGNIVTSGGRVLCVTALGETTKDAQEKAYSLIKKINWDGAYYRTDIGFKAIES
jgi:phosphoribosylamine---glycine ligase